MRFRCVSSTILIAFLLPVLVAACAARPASQIPGGITEPQTFTTTTKSLPRSEWDILVGEARKEGKVVIYGSVIGDTRDPMIKAFGDRYGVELEFLQGRGGEIVEKLLTERRAGLFAADVGIGGPTTFFSVITPQNIPVPLEPMIMLEEVKDPSKWRMGRIPYADEKKTIVGPVAASIPAIVVNADMIKETEIRSYDDLLAGKWKGKLTLNDPTLSGMGLQWFGYMIIQAYGREKGIEYMKKLALQQPVIVRDERLQVEWTARGRYPLAIGAKPTVVQSFVNTGANLAFVFVKEGAPLNPGPLMLYAFDKAAHPAATRLFVNWFLTKEAGEIMAKTSGYPSERTDVSKEGFPPAMLPGPTEVLGGDIGLPAYEAARSQLTKVAAEIFKDLLK